MNHFAEEAARLLGRLREKKPLVHHITNFVVMNDTANVTLHVGALPVMAHAREEVAEMVGTADALVLNYGRLTADWVESMLVAGRRDVVSDGKRVLTVDNGHAWLATRTGTGCSATALTAAFAAVAEDYALAAASALAAYGVAAERAVPHARGPASFGVAFFDELHLLTPERVAEGARIAEYPPR